MRVCKTTLELKTLSAPPTSSNTGNSSHFAVASVDFLIELTAKRAYGAHGQLLEVCEAMTNMQASSGESTQSGLVRRANA